MSNNYLNNITIRGVKSFFMWLVTLPILFVVGLINNKLLTIQQIYQLDLVISNEMDKAMNFAIKSPLNSNREIFKDVFDNDKPLPTSIKARINKILNS